MPRRYGDVWREVRLSVPNAPVFLVRKWVDDTYRNLVDRRGWGFATYQGQLAYGDARTFDVTVTQGGVQVTSAALFVPGDAGRQFRVGSYPIYTVQTYIDASTIELDLPFYGTGSGVVSAQILDAYATLPATFSRFAVVIDPINQRFIPWWMTQDELGQLDPVRMSSESVPRLLVGMGVSTYPPTLGQVRFEYWPKPTAAGALQYWAVKNATVPADDDVLQGVLSERPDVLDAGALAQAAKWPGTKDLPNPYFNLALARSLQQDYEQLCLQLDLRDDDQAQQSWSVIPWERWSAWTWAYDTRLLRMTDATIGDYWGGQSIW